MLLSITILLAAVSSGRAFDLNLAVGGGYDDNPRELEKGSGAAFTEVRLDGSHQFPLSALPNTSITIQGFAGGRLYNNVDNPWMGGGEIISTSSLDRFFSQLEFFTLLATFSNPEINDNDYNQLKIGGRLAWFISPRLTLEWENFISWEEYGADFKVTGSKRANGGNRKPMAHRSNRTLSASPPGHPSRHHNRGDRSDRVLGTALRTMFALNPYWESSGELFWQTRHSSLDSEKNRSYGFELGLFWHPLENLELSLFTNAARTPYRYDFRRKSHTEKSYGSSIGLDWKISRHWSISGSWEWYRLDSDIELDEYTRNQWYTHINFSY